MIKKTLCALITFCLLISAVPAASAAAADSPDTHIITSNCPDNYMDLKIQGSKLVVTGVLSTGFDSAFSAMIGVESGKKSYLTITPGKKFSIEISLGSVTKPVSFQIYTGPEEIGIYWGYIWHSIYI